MKLPTGIYIITNAESKTRAAVLDANEKSQVVASLGLSLKPEAGEKVGAHLRWPLPTLASIL